MSSGILTPHGTLASDTRWQGMTAPKGSSPFFGFIDPAGDPVTLRVDLVAAICRDARSGRYVVLLTNCGHTPALTDADALRLMQRMGWSLPPAAPPIALEPHRKSSRGPSELLS